jgi:two-component sensor histidine kinase
MIDKLCKKYTKLKDNDLKELHKISENLQIISNLVEADIFIDCITKDRDTAIVVAEAKPAYSPSMYDSTVIGEMAYRENEPAVLRTLETGMPIRDLKAITQEKKMVSQSTVPIVNEIDEVIGVLIMEKDVTQKVNRPIQMNVLAEDPEQFDQESLTIKESEQIITHYINDGIVVFNKERIATYGNPGAKEIYRKLGYKDDIIGMDFNNLVLGKVEFEQIIGKTTWEISELRVGRLSMQVKYATIIKNDTIVGINMLIKDITEVKEIEKELILKSVAIKEIHHRVKNNLQTIASLLRLQSRRIVDETAKKAFDESISRVLSIAVAHELLAQNGVDDVDLLTILTRIKDMSLDNIPTLGTNVQIHITGDSFFVNSDEATSIALVVNELLQNSMVYAFKGKAKGTIEVNIQNESIYPRISVVDDGHGFELNAINDKSLGLSIVQSIVEEKLHGSFSIQSDTSGTKVIFDFKIE